MTLNNVPEIANQQTRSQGEGVEVSSIFKFYHLPTPAHTPKHNIYYRIFDEFYDFSYRLTNLEGNLAIFPFLNAAARLSPCKISRTLSQIFCDVESAYQISSWLDGSNVIHLLQNL